MGGAVGGVLLGGAQVVSTAASLLGSDSAEQKYYRSLAATAEAQARQAEQNAQRYAAYVQEEAGQQSSQAAQTYLEQVGSQQAAFAANGISNRSATAQLILKNSRLNARMDQELIAQNMQRTIYENDQAAFLEAQQYRTQAQQYRSVADKNRLSWWGRVSSTVGNWLLGGQNGRQNA